MMCILLPGNCFGSACWTLSDRYQLLYTQYFPGGRMIQYNPLQHLRTAEELPDSDDTPVDNELQILIPNLLRAILALL